MADELVYTSAARGLKPGSRGFCIVAATANLSPKTITVLESLSAYRHLNLPTGGPHPGNPVAWSHLHLPSEGRSILSRVADAGLDYSGRTNKLAHHLVLGAGESHRTGPAAMLSAAGNLMAVWSGEPRMIAGRSLQPGVTPHGPCAHWRQLTGDAGWAGELARSGNAQSRVIVVTAAFNTLALVAEAMSLVPFSQRWRITFCTFDNGLPQGMTCHWRFVISGSPEHLQAQRTNPAGLLDLTSPMTLAPDSPFATMARSGDRTSLGSERSATAPTTSSPATRPPVTANRNAEKLAAITARATAPPLNPNAPLLPPTPPRPKPLSVSLPPEPPAEKKSSLVKVLVLLGIVGTLLCVLLGVGGYFAYTVVMATAQPRKGTPKTIEQVMQKQEDKIPVQKQATVIEESSDSVQPHEAVDSKPRTGTENLEPNDAEIEDETREADAESTATKSTDTAETPKTEPATAATKTLDIYVASIDRWTLPAGQEIEDASVFVNAGGNDGVARFKHVERYVFKEGSLGTIASELGNENFIPSYTINKNRSLAKSDTSTEDNERLEFILTKLRDGKQYLLLPTGNALSASIEFDEGVSLTLNDSVAQKANGGIPQDLPTFKQIGSGSMSAPLFFPMQPQQETPTKWEWVENTKVPEDWETLKGQDTESEVQRLKWTSSKSNKHDLTLSVQLVPSAKRSDDGKSLQTSFEMKSHYEMKGYAKPKPPINDAEFKLQQTTINAQNAKLFKPKKVVDGQLKNSLEGKEFELRWFGKYQSVQAILEKKHNTINARLLSEEDITFATVKLSVDVSTRPWTVSYPPPENPREKKK